MVRSPGGSAFLPSRPADRTAFLPFWVGAFHWNAPVGLDWVWSRCAQWMHRGARTCQLGLHVVRVRSVAVAGPI